MSQASSSEYWSTPSAHRVQNFVALLAATRPRVPFTGVVDLILNPCGTACRTSKAPPVEREREEMAAVRHFLCASLPPSRRG